VLLCSADDKTTSECVSEMDVTSDDDQATIPTKLKVGSVQFFVIKRGNRLGVRAKDCQSPVLLDFKGIENFPIDLNLRVEAKFVPYDPPKVLKVPTAIGDITDELCPGKVTFQINGVDCSLYVTGDPTIKLFVVFADQTSGKETYGGGRFLYTPPVTPQNTVTIDFNKAYNPPCVFTPFATCPHPVPQNRLPIPIKAGEKTYGDH